MKYKVGDRVRPTIAYCKWELDHFEEMHAIHGMKDGLGRKVTNLESAHEYAFWLTAFKGAKVYGKVIGFGSDCLKVSFRSKYGKTVEFIDDKNLRKVR